jgi:hypothetical protein
VPKRAHERWSALSAAALRSLACVHLFVVWWRGVITMTRETIADVTTMD